MPSHKTAVDNRPRKPLRTSRGSPRLPAHLLRGTSMAMDRGRRRVALSIRITPELKDEVARIAADGRHSWTVAAEILLEEAVEARRKAESGKPAGERK